VPVRTKRFVATFSAPFLLASLDEIQPAGSYAVSRDEEMIEGVSFPAWRRLETLIYLPALKPGGYARHMVRIEADELALATVVDESAAVETG